MLARVVAIAVVVAAVGGGSTAVQIFNPRQINDLVMLCLEMQGEVAALATKTAEGAFEGPTEVLDLLAVVDRDQVATHFRVLRLGASLPSTPAELG